jgi:hypothetical protein
MDGLTKAAVERYVGTQVEFRAKINKDLRTMTLNRIQKILSLLPGDALDLFLSGKRDLTVSIVPDLEIPFGMHTESQGSPKKRTYKISIYKEQLDLEEDIFIGALLRELGHVAAQRPPESEWPATRGDRARFKERLESVADATVWKWGLKHYSIRHITATYPEHWADKIIKEIAEVMLEDAGSYS